MTELLTFDLTVAVPEKATLKNEGEIALNDLNKPCHGVALWMEYRLTDARTVSGGLVKVGEEGEIEGEERTRERERERCLQLFMGVYTQLLFRNFFAIFTTSVFMNHVYVTGICTQEPGSYTEKLEWSPNHKQAVYFLPPQFVRQSLINLNYSLSFSTDSGHLELAFTGVH